MSTESTPTPTLGLVTALGGDDHADSIDTAALVTADGRAAVAIWAGDDDGPAIIPADRIRGLVVGLMRSAVAAIDTASDLTDLEGL